MCRWREDVSDTKERQVASTRTWVLWALGGAFVGLVVAEQDQKPRRAPVGSQYRGCPPALVPSTLGCQCSRDVGVGATTRRGGPCRGWCQGHRPISAQLAAQVQPPLEGARTRRQWSCRAPGLSPSPLGLLRDSAQEMPERELAREEEWSPKPEGWGGEGEESAQTLSGCFGSKVPGPEHPLPRRAGGVADALAFLLRSPP